MVNADLYMPASPYKGLSPYSETDRLFFFGREEDREKIIDNLTTWRLTILYGESGVGKSSVLQAGVAYHLRQAAQRNADISGNPEWAMIVFPPVENKIFSWQDPLNGIKEQLKSEIAKLLDKSLVEIEKKFGTEINSLFKDLQSPPQQLSLVDTLKAWTRIIPREEGNGRLFIILDQFEEYFVYLSHKDGKDSFLEEFSQAVNDPELSANFLVAIRSDSLTLLDKFRANIWDLFKNRLPIKHLDRESAIEAINKPIHEYNRQKIILENLLNSRLTILAGRKNTHKSTILRSAITPYLRQHNVGVVLFNDWRISQEHDLFTACKNQIAKDLDNSLPTPKPELSLVETLGACTKPTGGATSERELLLILDQFEDYFWKQAEIDPDKTFINELLSAIHSNSLNVKLLIAIREDWLSELDSFADSIPCQYYLHLYKDQEGIDRIEEKPIVPESIPLAEQEARQQILTEKSITIAPDLVEKIVEDVTQTGLRGSSPSVSSEAQVETPYLQLVMLRLWKEEMSRIQREEQEWQEGKRTTPPLRQLQKTTYTDQLGGAKKIVRDHLYAKLEQDSLSAIDRETAARIFNYLVTPSGAKIAQSVSDLVGYANENRTGNQSKLECEPVRKLLEKLITGESRLLRRVGAADQPYEQHYEIFHDVLGPAILEWRRNYRDRKQKEDLEQLKKDVQEILENLSASMGFLSEQEQDIAARCFPYLGTHHPYSVTDLAEQVGCEPTQLADILNKFANDRIVRLVDPSPDQPNDQRYELFHDLLTPSILEWQKAYLERKKQQEIKQQEIKQKKQLIGICMGTGAIILLGWTGIRAYQDKSDRMIAESQQAVQQFEAGQQLVALQGAMQTGQWVQTWVKNNPVSGIFLGQDKQQQLISQSTVTLQQTLARIQEQNQFGQVQSWDLSRDGQTLATGSADGTVQLWKVQTDSKTDGKLASFKALGQLRGLGFSPDGQTLATVSADGTVQRWDGQTGQEQAHFSISSSNWNLNIFSPARPLLAIAVNDRTVQLWNWQIGKKEQASFTSPRPVFGFIFSPSSPVLAIASDDNTVQLWNWETNTTQTAFKASGTVSSLRFSPDGQTLAAILADGTVQLWNPQQGSQPFKLADQVASISWSANGQILATSSGDGTVQLWDWKTGKQQAQFKASGLVTSLRFGPDDHTLITVLRDGTLRLWALSKENRQTQLDSSEKMQDLSFSPNGQTLATVSAEGKVQLWDWKTGKPQPPLPVNQVVSLRFSPVGQRLATSSLDGKVQLWDWKTGDKQAESKTLSPISSSPVRSLGFSSDGQTLATFSVDGTVQVWDLQTRQPESQFKVPGLVVGLDFSPDGQTLAVSLADGTVQVWDGKTDQQKSRFNGSGILLSLSFSPDGRTLATGSSDGTVQVWDWTANKLRNSFFISSGAISSLRFSPDGQTLAIGSEKGIILSDVNGNRLAQFQTAGSALSLRFSPDGQTLATLSSQGTVRMWPVGGNLSGLLDQGCQWLQLYLASHPNERQDLSCQRP